MSQSRTEILHRLRYVLLSLGLIVSQNIVAWWAWATYASHQPVDLEFWLTPLRSALEIGSLPPIWGAAIFTYCLLVAWLLALLSFRLAQRTNRGFILAVLSVVPLIQIGAIAINAILPGRDILQRKDQAKGQAAKNIVLGLVAGIALVVFAVIISAVTFGAYGWGLFVMTPFLVGTTTGFLVNAERDLGNLKTMELVVAAAGLGSLALVVLALEGVVCILLAAPLAVPVVMLGGVLGRRLAIARLRRRSPLASVAILPMIFMFEAAIPPEAPISAQYDIVIAAPPEHVWHALTSSDAIKVQPGLTALAGLAYPTRSRLEGEGIGATRIGSFSTGNATEVVTRWERNKVLAFRVDNQPPAMEEMSPYRRVHAPHLQGYFVTGETRFDLTTLAGNRTRLRVTTDHRLRIDPVMYWEPIARLAIRQNIGRVLEDIKEKSERDM